MSSVNRVRATLTSAWPYLVLAVFVIAAKFQLIAFYGNATPYWDQWDSEADLLYRPWLDGNYDWKQLFSPHNEHRILTTRLLALALLELGGKAWNPLLQMKVNGFLHVGAISVLLYFLCKGIRGGHRTVLFLFAGALFAIPFGWENTLAGFQSQFYMLLLFSFVFLWAMSALPCYSSRWWLGLLAGVLSLFSMASGALTVLAGGLTLLVRRYWFDERREVAFSAIVLTLGIALLAIHFTPSIAGHAGLKADSPLALLKALVKIVAWPASRHGEGLLFVQVPLLILVAQVLWRRTTAIPRPAGLVFILAMAIWLFGQFASIAYGRAAGALSSRYLDLFAVGLMLNLAALLYLHAAVPPGSKGRGRQMNGAIVLWLAVVTFGFIKSAPNLAEDLRFKARSGAEQEKNVRAYLCSGDVANLTDKTFLYVPYPDPIRLKKLLDNPTIRRILPGNINEARSKRKAGPDGEPFCNTGSPDRAFDVIKLDAAKRVEGVPDVGAVKSNDWRGGGATAGQFSGYQVMGSFVESDRDTGTLVLHLRRGNKLLYRSGPRVNGQFMLINNGRTGHFSTALPSRQDWTVLEFSGAGLPEEFDVTFIDAGTQWGEWSAIALRDGVTP